MGDLNNSSTVQITGTIMVIAIIVFFLVIVFVLFLHIYAKWFWWRVEAPPPGRRQRRHAMDGREPVERGLDLCLLRSLPVVIVESEDDGLECAVCLSEIVVGERGRVLPKCKHGFHVECIDMWFQSHSTCPLCRSSVSDSNNDQKLSVSPTNGPDPAIAAPPSSSANVLVIDVPPPLQMSDSVVEDEPKSPAPTRLGSFKRLLSRESDTRMPPTSTSSAYEV